MTLQIFESSSWYSLLLLLHVKLHPPWCFSVSAQIMASISFTTRLVPWSPSVNLCWCVAGSGGCEWIWPHTHLFITFHFFFLSINVCSPSYLKMLALHKGMRKTGVQWFLPSVNLSFFPNIALNRLLDRGDRTSKVAKIGSWGQKKV